MVKKALGALGAAVLVPPVALVMFIVVIAGDDSSNESTSSGTVTGVPDQYQQYVWQAGQLCDVLTPSVIAAQADHESAHTWDPTITSPAGATGISQFMPATWAIHGKDGDGDGRADITNGADSIISQGHYMCDLAEQIKAWKADGIVSGDLLDLTLAAYNAGPGAVKEYGGIPPYEETHGYVVSIRAAIEQFQTVGPAPAVGNGDGSTLSQARSHLGTPYVWGGATSAGVDCSGLIVLTFQELGQPFVNARSAHELINSSQVTSIARSDLAPGDMIGFSYQGTDYIHHIGFYAGTDNEGHPIMLHAPDAGGVVEEVRLDTPYWQGMTWHPARKTS